MTITKLKIFDLIMSVLLLGGAIVATVLTHFGAKEVLYFVPYVVYEGICITVAKIKGWW